MIGTAIGLVNLAARSITTIMFTYPIQMSHLDAATILQDLRLQTVRVQSVGLAVWAGLVESAGLGQSVDRGELAGQAVSGVQGESAGLWELAGVLDRALSAERVSPTGWQDHLLAHTIRPRPGRTRGSVPT
jgi:hypothetical protein